jgi:hypothetical protein
MSACSPSSSGSGGGDTTKGLYQGDLDQKIGEIYGEKNALFFRQCELTWKDKAIEVSRFLESHRAEIEAFYKTYLDQKGSDTYDFIQMGRFTFKDPKKKVVGTDAWTEYQASWSEAYTSYQNIKNTPVNLDWVRLNSYVRAMIPDEESRITHGQNYGLSKDTESLANSIYGKVQACVDDANCTLPDFTPEDLHFFDEATGESWYVNRLRFPSARDSVQNRRDYLGKLLKRVQGDKGRYTFTPSDIAKVNGSQLEIPMDLSSLGDGADKFAQYIESIWNNDGEFKIKIIQKHSPDIAYVVDVSDIVGERASVHGKKMQLYNLGVMKTFPHEFGHVLGFRDNYYTLWDSGSCVYKEQSNIGDIMSNHTSGQVLPRHWDVLKKTYWNK